MPNENETLKRPDWYKTWLDYWVEIPLTPKPYIPYLQSVRDFARAELAALREECDDQGRIIARQGKLLTDAINVIRGKPDELCLHSHHDIAERAAELRERVGELEMWKGEQQKALIACSVMLLDAGYKGDGIVDGLRWALGDAKQTREIAKYIESCNDEIENQLRERVKQLESEAKQARDAALDEAANAAWDAINNAMPDGSWHDAQEIVNTTILSLKGGGDGTTG